MADQNVRFIRKNGRVIPIREKSGSGGKKSASRPKATALVLETTNKKVGLGERIGNGARWGADFGLKYGSAIGGLGGLLSPANKSLKSYAVSTAIGVVGGGLNGAITGMGIGAVGNGLFGRRNEVRVKRVGIVYGKAKKSKGTTSP